MANSVETGPSRRQFLARGLGAAGLIILPAGVTILAGCADGSNTPSSTGSSGGVAESGGKLSLLVNQAPEVLLPGGNSQNGSIWPQQQIFDRLVAFPFGSDEPQPSLASSWTPSEDGLSYIITLRKAQFSNGDPVTAEDVKYSLERFSDPELDPDYSFATASYKSISIVDPETIRLDLKYVDASVIPSLGYIAAGIVPKDLVQEMGDDEFAQQPVGAGPFKVKTFAPGQELVLERNPHYWSPGLPHLDELTITYAPNDTTRMLSVASGQAQVGTSVPFTQADEIGKAGVNVQEDKLLSIWSVWLNHDFGPLADRSVRQALNYATPKSQIIETTLQGYGTIANSNAPDVPLTDANISPYPYDVAKAKTLLTQTGPFTVPLAIAGGDQVSLQTAQILQAAWAEVGVTVEISQYDSGTLWAKWYDGTSPCFLTPTDGWTLDLPIPDGFAIAVYNYWDGGTNAYFTNYKSREAQELSLALNQSIDETIRKEKWQALQQLTLDDAVTVPIAFVPTLSAVRDEVEGFHALQVGGWQFSTVSLR